MGPPVTATADGAARTPVVVLIGPPGSGKSTVGAVLADLLQVPFHDTDAAIVAAQGRSIADIFLEDDEASFRELEHAEVVRALCDADGVLSVGGGSVLDPRTQQALAGHAVIFLDVGIADAAKRVGFDRSRPLLGINPRAQWVRLMQARRPTYERLAGFRVDTAGRSPHEVAAEIAAQLVSGVHGALPGGGPGDGSGGGPGGGPGDG